MRKKIHAFLLFSAALAALAAWGANAGESANISSGAAKGRGIQAITKPSDDRTLCFERPGKVAVVNVDINSEVKAGDVLAMQDDTEHRLVLQMDRHKVEKTDPISRDAEIKVHAQKQLEVDRMKAIGSAVGASELAAAELEVVVALARIAIATDQIAVDELKVKQTEAALAKLTLKVPDDCRGAYVVAQPAYPNQSLMKVGEIADSSPTRSVRIVRIDPMWVDVPTPLATARKLKAGDVALVTVADGDKVLTGSVQKIFYVGDAASGTRIVRVEVPNPEKKYVGEPVFVNFPASADVAANP